MNVYLSVINTINFTVIFSKWIESFSISEDKIVAQIQTTWTADFASHRQTIRETEYRIAGEMGT